MGVCPNCNKKKNQDKCSKSAAFIAKINGDSIANPVLYFDLGMGTPDAISIDQKGGRFRFHQSGLYRIQIRGACWWECESHAELVIRRKPDFDESQENFAKFSQARGKIRQSTILPFREKHIMSIVLYAPSKMQAAVSDGTQIEIYKVGEL